eukprot:2893031-Prymnesium_polylepis.1
MPEKRNLRGAFLDLESHARAGHAVRRCKGWVVRGHAGRAVRGAACWVVRRRGRGCGGQQERARRGEP